MDAARATHFGPGPRLASLAALLRTTTGAPVPVVADLADGLALPAGSIACLVLDLAAVPVDDLGLVRRLRARQPSLVVLWTGPASLAPILTAVADAGDEFRPWPLDVTLLPGFRAERPRTVEATEGHERSAHRTAPEGPPRDVSPHVAGARRTHAEPVPSKRPASVLDPDLRHIEAILAGLERGGLANTGGNTGPAPRPAHRPNEVRPSVAATATPRELEDLEGFGELAELGDFERDPDDEPDSGSAELVAPFVSDGPLLSHEELEAFLAPEPSPPGHGTDDPSVAGQGPGGAPSRGVRGLPHWYRDQVADLADLVQRAELALHAAESSVERRSGPNGEPAMVLAGARLELGRLRQFARTLGCLAAPPAAGAARVDLGVLVEETLASLAQRTNVADSAAASSERVEGRPRFLFRSQTGVSVHADKSLLVAALDAVLGVAASAGGAADVVRTEVLATDAGVAEVRVDLPEGRLAGLEPARILEPYALRKRMPGIGAHALAAAGGILVGHGGDLVLERRPHGAGERGRLVFVLRLPSV